VKKDAHFFRQQLSYTSRPETLIMDLIKSLGFCLDALGTEYLQF